jgi:cation transport regulator ChaB
MSNSELAQSIRHKLFAERETLKEAYEYAFSVFRTLGKNEMAATTAFMVVMNTLANELEKSNG